MENENLTLQKDEIEALSSIYCKDFKCESDSGSYYSIKVENDVTLYITLNSSYPSEAPPTYQLLAPSLSRSTKQRIENAFEEIYLKNLGQSVIYEWTECLRGIVQDCKDRQGTNSEDNIDNTDKIGNESAKMVNPENFNIVHGTPITDRKSTFQAHFCEVHSQDDVRSVINILLQNKKIHQATHNISAYRIKSNNGAIIQDCDDDGENHAGGRLMHLLHILDVSNVLVVVSRWYGGIQLGPDRFRHINNAARGVLQQAGKLP